MARTKYTAHGHGPDYKQSCTACRDIRKQSCTAYRDIRKKYREYLCMQ